MQNTFGLGPYGIGVGSAGRKTYLPGGNWGNASGRNNLPGACEGFVFLEVIADFSDVDGDPNKTVFVPCYFKG